MNPQIISNKGKGLAFSINSPSTALGQNNDGNGGKLVLTFCNYKLLFLEAHQAREVVSNSSIKVSAGLVKSKSC